MTDESKRYVGADRPAIDDDIDNYRRDGQGLDSEIVEEARKKAWAKKYKPCADCAQARANGAWADAITCRACDGKGAVRTRESWVCNRCGGCLCPSVESLNREIPHGLVDVTVSGGYDSPAFSDGTTYQFSICETCLRALFDGFKLPPMISDYMDGGATETYAEETRNLLRAREAEVEREAKRSALHEQHRCTATLENSQFCGAPGVLTAVSYRCSWHLCTQHSHDAFVWQHAVVAGLSWADRVQIGRRYLDAFAKSERIEPANEHETSIFISTLFPLVALPATAEQAATELARLSCADPGTIDTWVSLRVAANFAPGSTAAVQANAWLAWGRREGYLNATAAAFLGYSPERMWSLEARHEHK
jgi:hypothetical protein